ncbi:MAG: hypothetical protein MK116_08600 [Phycisphaerales bacterium]|nr:hypothetical protein [Phycisphaerales bacterium]
MILGVILLVFLGLLVIFLMVVVPISWFRKSRRDREHLHETARLFAQHLEEGVFPVDVRIVPLPSSVRNVPLKILGMLILDFYLLSFSIAIILEPWDTGNDSSLGVPRYVLVGVMIAIAALVPTLFVRALMRARRFLTPLYSDHPEAPLLAALTQARVPTRPSRGRKAREVWRRFTEALGDASSPRTAVDKVFLASVTDVELVSELQEPVPIVSGPVRTTRDSVTALVGLAILLLISLVGSFWFTAAVGAVMLYILVTIPQIRNLVPGLRLESRALLAGPGFIRNRTGAAWTCDEAIMIVRAATRRRHHLQPIQAQVIGPEGVAAIEFSSIHDSDFQALWANWNSTHPRPELARAPI